MTNKLIVLLYLLSSIQAIYQVSVFRDFSQNPEYQELKRFEKEAKWLLPGLPEKVDREKLLLKSSGIYLKKIYSYLSEKFPRKPLESRDVDNLKKNNLMMTFMSQVSSDSPVFNSVYKKKYNLWFDVSKILITSKDNNYNLTEAELHVFRNGKRSREVSSKVKLTVYRMELGLKNLTSNLIDSVIVEGNYTGWVRFNMTKCFKYWQEYPHDNLGVSVAASIVGQEHVKHEIGELGVSKYASNPKKQSFLTAFFKDDKNISFYSTKTGSIFESVGHKRESDEKERFCKVTTEKTNLNRDDKYWILAPRNYSINSCSNKCVKNISDHLKINDEKVYLVKESFHEARSCKANKYKGKLFSYYINNHNFVLRYIDDVASCTCV